MPRSKKLDPDAEQVAVYLNPTEKLVMDVIAARRKKRGETRTSQSEIVVDALWKVLTDVEGVARQRIEELIPASATDIAAQNLKQFPKKEHP